MKPLAFLSTGLVAVTLVAIGHAAVSSLSKEASSAICASNLKTLVTATSHYATDHQGQLPLAVDRKPKPWKWWYSELFPYVPSMSAFYCPVKAPEFFSGSDFSPLLPIVWDYRFLSYGYSAEIDLKQRGGAPLTLAEFNNPPRVLLVESDDYLVSPGATAWPKQVAVRHDGCAHFALSDGSIAFEIPGPPPSKGGEGIHQISKWRIP